MRQTFLSKPFANSLNMQKQCEEMFGKRAMTRSRCRSEYRPHKTHINLFLPQYQHQRKVFFLERELKKVLRGMFTRADSYRQRPSNF